MQKSLALCLFLTTALPACTEGDRALQGKCPAGETCSDQAPNGLTFHGVTRSSISIDLDAIPPTAVGGTQTIELLDARSSSATSFGVWRAEPSGPVAIEGQTGNHVTVRGTGDGEAMLRIVAGRDGKLLDRHAVSAATVARVGLIGMGELHTARSVVWFLGTKIDAAIGLESAAGDHLVDEKMTVALAPGRAVLERSAWDRVAIQGAPLGPLTLTVTAGNLAPQRVELSVVDAIDSVTGGAMTVDHVEAGQSFLYCFEGRSGSAAVNGLAWTYTAEGATVDPRGALFNGCAVFTTTAVGRATITAKAAGKAATAIVDVTRATTPTSPAHLRAAQLDDGAAPSDSDDEDASDGAVDATLGDRALLD